MYSQMNVMSGYTILLIIILVSLFVLVSNECVYGKKYVVIHCMYILLRTYGLYSKVNVMHGDAWLCYASCIL